MLKCVLRAGTGKTTLLRGLVSFIKSQMPGNEIAVTAPTGRAAVRLREVTGEKGKTLHRQLNASIFEDDGGKTTFYFGMNATNLLTEDFIIIDEMSMVDIEVCARRKCV